jgi:sodium/potassium-transporting ATPase subunit alpha
MPVTEVAEKYDSRLHVGLNAEERIKRLERYGPNVPKPAKSAPEFVKWLKELFGWFGILLWLGAALSIIAFFVDPSQDFTNLYTGIVLAFVVLLSGTVSYIQNSRLEFALKRIQNYSHQAMVLVDGKLQRVDISKLVIGDIVYVAPGDMIPADIRIVECEPNFKIDNSSLFPNETKPLLRTVDNWEEDALNATNLAFYGTFVTGGAAYGIVFAIGSNTLKCRVSKRIHSTEYPWVDIPIVLKMDRLVLILTAIAIFICVLLFVTGLIIARGTNVVPNIVFMIGVLVAMVSQGLFLTLMFALTLTLRKVAKKHVHLRRLESFQRFTSTTAIFTDAMALCTPMGECSHLWFDKKLFDYITISNEVQSVSQKATLRKLIKAATLSNNASVSNEGSEIIGGDVADRVLLQLCLNFRSSIRNYYSKYPKIFESSTTQYNEFSVIINKIKRRRFLLTVRGAFEEVLNKCSHVIVNGKLKPLNNQTRKSFRDICNQLENNGETVIVFAQKELDRKEYPRDFKFKEISPNHFNFSCNGLALIGFISFRSSPKPLVPEALNRCKELGIKVILWSEKLLSTTFLNSIGLSSENTLDNISNDENLKIQRSKRIISDKMITVSEEEMCDFNQSDWDHIVNENVIVFTKISPRQKLLIINKFQERGQVVAFVARKIEDRAAFLSAHLKVAMGVAGNVLFKEKSDVILLDDNFVSLVKSLEKGRLIFDNLKKSIAYILASNLPKLTSFLMFIWVGLPFPLTTVLVLCLDINTNILPAMSLLYEAPEKVTFDRRTDKTKSLFNSILISFSYCQVGVIESLAGLFAYFVVMGYYGFSPVLLPETSYYWDDTAFLILSQGVFYRREALAHAQTAFFVALIVNQWINLIICKTRQSSLFQHGMWFNKLLLLALVVETAFACLIIYTPPLNYVFGTRPLIFLHWLPGLPFAALIFCYDEIRKCMIRSYPRGFVAKWTHW